MKVVTFSIALVALVVPRTYGYVPTSDFFPFGIGNGDAQPCIDGSVSIDHPLLSAILNSLSRTSESEVIALCNDWYIIDPGTSPSAALPCPPTLALAQVDERFEIVANLLPYNPEAQVGYVQRVPSAGGEGQRCVYNQGILLVGPKSGGNVQSVSPNGKQGELPHIRDDLLAWATCCYATDDLASCEKYYERRPSDDGTNYVARVYLDDNIR